MEAEQATRTSLSAYEDRSTTPQPHHNTISIERSDSGNSSASSMDDHNADMSDVIPSRPRPIRRKSSGTIIVPRDSEDAMYPVETRFDPGDVRAMSPRRTSEDLQEMGRQTRDEMRKHAKLLQDSLLMIFHRIQAVKEEHDKLDNNNKFLQKYIGDLMSTSKITATSSRGKK